MTIKKARSLPARSHVKSHMLMRSAERVGSQILDVIMPPHSLLTGRPYVVDDSTAPDMTGQDMDVWNTLVFLDNPCCTACGFPFEFDQGGTVLCGPCHTKRPNFHRARAAITYDDHSKKLILDFKHGGRTDGLSFFAAQLSRVGHEILSGADILIPVPLHAKRLRQRRFNQSALMARALSKHVGKPYDCDSLLRTKDTQSQGGKSYAGRRKNVAAAFAVRRGHTKNVTGKHLVLIDDVYTTGATLEACSKTLYKAGAARVDALTLLRVVRPVSVIT
jgi:ComF family protein